MGSGREAGQVLPVVAVGGAGGAAAAPMPGGKARSLPDPPLPCLPRPADALAKAAERGRLRPESALELELTPGTPRFGVEFGARMVSGTGEDRIAVALPANVPMVHGEALLAAAARKGESGEADLRGRGEPACLARSEELDGLGVHCAFAVLDGFGGADMSEFAARGLLPTLLATARAQRRGRRRSGADGAGGGRGEESVEPPTPAEFHALLEDTFQELDAAFAKRAKQAARAAQAKQASSSPSCLPLTAFLCGAARGRARRGRGDGAASLAAQMDSSVPRGAACAACVFVRPVGLAPHFSALEAVAANVGDCRVALLVDGDLHALSVKHTPGAAPAELERVRNAGCAVGRAVDKKGNHHGPLRVYPGGLAVTRALGGSAYAKAVTPIPAVRSVTLPPHCWSRLIVASNGVWSALPQRAVERVLASHGEPAAAARALVAAARMRRPGMDDTTVVVVDIPPMDWNEAGVTGGERTPGMASHSRSRSHLPTKPWPLEAVRPVEHPIGLRAAQDDEASETGREGGGSGLTRTVSDLTMTGEHVRASFASEARGLSGLTVLDEMPSRKVGPPGRLEESYKLGKVLGHGKYGHVYAATTRDAPHREVAVKAVDLRSEVLRRRVCEELDCLVQVSGRHPRVPRVEATFEQCFSGDGVVHVCIVTDRYRGGTLLDYLGSLETLDDTIVATLMGQLLSALAFLHAQHPPIAHRDIKPTNIMIRDGAAEDPQLVLLDFGLATCVGTASHGGRSLNAMAGTRFFQAPEVVAREGYGVSADIWSCGVLLWALLAGMPAPGAPVREAFEIIQRGELPPSTPTNLSDDLRDLLSQMLQPDPSKRVTARNALNHPWLARTREHAHSYAGGKSARPVSPSDLSVVSCESDADLSRRSSNGDFSEGSMHGIQAMQSAAAFEAEALAALRDHLNAHETRTVLRELNLGADMHLGLTEGTTLASDLEDALLEVGCSEAHAAITLLCFRYGNPNMLALSSAKLVAMLGVHAMYATTSSARGEATGDSPPLFGGGRERWRHSSASSAGSSQSSGRAYASTGTYGGAARSFLAGGMAGAAA